MVAAALKEFDKVFFPKPIEFVELIQLRKNLIREEFAEVMEAIEYLETAEAASRIFHKSEQAEDNYKKRKEELLKELVDLVYVTVGTATQLDYNFDEAFKRVHESNMAKVGSNGKLNRREDGKILKPKEWKKPTMEGLV